MSAELSFTQRSDRYRSTVQATIGECGPAALTMVLVGGLSLGFSLWYGLVAHLRHGTILDEFALAASLGIGVAVAAVAWYEYGAYLERRTDLEIDTAMRYDAYAWVALAIFPLGLLLPLPISLGPVMALAFGTSLFIKLLLAARFNQTVRDVLIVFVVTRVPILVIAELASSMIAQRAGRHTAISTNPLLAVWGRWDAVHFLDIAREGYYGFDMAFFPLYPSLIHVLGSLIGSNLIAGLVISNVAFFFGLLYLYKLVEHQYDRATAHRAVFYISIFPTAIFFSAIYTESLFFALTVASFYYIREHKWLTAGVVGGLAALTRVEGILLVVPFFIEAFLPESPILRPSTWWGFIRRMVTGGVRTVRIAVAVALIPLGLGCYMALLWVLRGDPLFFARAQDHWNRHLAPPWVSLIHSVMLIAKGSSVTISHQVLELGFTVLMLAVLVGSFNRLKFSYWSYMALSVLAPMSTSSLMSMPRFALVLFPMFVMFAVWGARGWVNSAIVAFSLPLLGLFTVLFSAWYWVA